MSEVRVRFAPSPTGKLHIGGARTAIYNWAFARAQKGTFILRIEDTDPERSTAENVELILRAMRWLGLDWDEGPEVGGDAGPYFQTERADTYADALERLKASGAVYPCFCTPDEIAEMREAANKEGKPAARTCRHLDPQEAQARIDAGEPHVWRLKVPEDRGEILVHDAVHGDTIFDSGLQDDMIVVRSDGSATYNFAVVVDDANMKITHVIRGDDHLPNTPRQILLYEALGYPTPVFAHIPMICGPDGKKLSKRHGAASVEEYRDEGYLADALFNYLALLGWAPDGETTIFDRAFMTEHFSLDHISKNPASLDPDKLDWINNRYIQQMGASRFVDELVPYLVEAGYTDAQADVDARRDWYEAIYPLVCERVKLMRDAVPMITYLLDEDLDYDEKSVRKILQKEGAGAKTHLHAEGEILEKVEWNEEAIETALRDYVEEAQVKARFVLQPLRVAITGSQVSPPLFGSIALLKRSTVLQRIEKAEELAVD